VLEDDVAQVDLGLGFLGFIVKPLFLVSDELLGQELG